MFWVDDKFLIHPAASHPNQEFIRFSGSREFIVKKKVDFIKIIEKDGAAGTVFFLDPTKIVKNKAYHVYRYKPREVTLEKVKKLAAIIRVENPNFDMQSAFALYNRHGVAFFGDEEIIEDGSKQQIRTLYWENPHEETACKYNRGDLVEFMKRSGIRHFKTRDGQVDLSSDDMLNAEKAERIEGDAL